MRFWTFSVLCIFLSSCQINTVQTGEPSLTFSHLAPITFNVAEMEIIDSFQSSYNAPDVEFQFPIPPGVAVTRWIKDRIETSGSQGKLLATIKDATVKEQPLPTRGGLMDIFYIEPSERYEAHVVVSFGVLDGSRALPIAEATVEITRSQTIQENASLADREALFVNLTEQLMEDFNTEAEKQIHTYLGSFLN